MWLYVMNALNVTELYTLKQPINYMLCEFHLNFLKRHFRNTGISVQTYIYLGVHHSSSFKKKLEIII